MLKTSQSTKQGILAALGLGNGPEANRVQFYLRVLLALNLFLYGYFYLLLGGYVIIAGLRANPGLTDTTGRPIGADFVAYWAGAALARGGDAASVYDIARLHAVELAVIGADLKRMAWNYPPTFLLLVLPLAYLPYLAAFTLWITAPLFGLLALLRRLAPHPLTPWLFLAFPGLVANFLYGQNGFLSALILGGGLMLLERRPLTGGALLGLLSYKPQLAALIPMALLAGRYWRALAGAVAAGGGLALASLAVFGVEPWAAFFKNLPFAANLMNQEVYWAKMSSTWAAARLMGVGAPAAMALQGIVTVLALGAVLWAWGRRTPLPWRGTVLCLGLLLAPPYVFEYDLAILAVPFAWLGWEEVREGRGSGQAVLICCWLAFYLNGFLLPIRTTFPADPLILAVLLGFVLYRLSQSRGAALKM